MKKPIQTRTIFLGLCIMSIFIISACSQNIQETNKYYNPAWMANGKIICVHSYEKVAIGSSSSGIYGSGGGTILAQNNYLTVIDPTTNTEHNVLDLPWGTYPELNCSPKGTYLAMHTNGLDIYQLSNMQKISTITVNEEIYAFDWSPDETKLIVEFKNSGGVYLYNINGGKIRKFNSVDFLYGWKYNPLILGGLWLNTPEKVAIIQTNDDDNLVTKNSQIGDGGQYFPNGNSCYGYFKKIRISDFQILETYNNLKTELESVDWHIISINPINHVEILFTNEHSVNPDYNKNILIINLDGTNRRNIR